MMKIRPVRYIALLFVFVFFTMIPNGRAQQPDVVDTSFFMTIDEANYDSLLHYFYMQQYAKSAKRHQSKQASLAYAEFDNIPDSVFVKRLHDLHMVVPLTYNSEVRAYIKAYVRIMSRRLDAMLSLSEYYFPMFEETLDRYGVPEELKYLTIVESAMNPQATSRAGAAGLWQFMYSTGKLYDLEVNSLVDERRDPYKSTVAAARYLKRLYDLYGDWQLAMAAYNCGPGNVNKAIARSGGKNSFWDIYNYLPRETRGYIPKYIGATYVMNYYHEHGMTAGRYELPIRIDTVNLKSDVHFAIVEKFTSIPCEQLRQLNPQFRTDVVPASSRSYAIALPSDKMSLFIRCEDTIYKESKDTIGKNAVVPLKAGTIVYHKVRRGETFTSIAKKYGVTVSTLKRWNGKGRRSTLKAGERLKIHLAAQTESKNDDTDQTAEAEVTKTDSLEVKKTDNETKVAKPKPAPKPKYYTVRKGDNLSKIAQRHGITVKKLKEMNNLKSDVVRVGQRLKVGN